MALSTVLINPERVVEAIDGPGIWSASSHLSPLSLFARCFSMAASCSAQNRWKVTRREVERHDLSWS
jgi:hypothetical protein